MSNRTNYYGGGEWRRLNPPKPPFKAKPGQTAFQALLELEMDRAAADIRATLNSPHPIITFLDMDETTKRERRQRIHNRDQYYRVFLDPFLTEYDALIKRWPMMRVRGDEDGDITFRVGNTSEYR